MRTFGVLAVLGLVLALATPAGAAFPGRNGPIAFSHGVGGVFEVAAVTPEGMRAEPRIPIAEGPAYSPDGRWIAYAVPPGRGRRGGLRLARADGTHRRVLTRNTLGADGAPAWSPDGRTLVFHRYVSGEGSFEATLYTIRRDGTGRRRLARGLFPAWSRNGEIAFVRQISATVPFTDGIHALRSDGRGLRRLTQDSRDGAPSWSPGGTRLAFSRAGGIARMRADGTGVVRLTRRGAEPAWSPDGRRIVFSRGDSLWTMRADGTRVRRLTAPAANQEFTAPDWQPLPVTGAA
jgi:Tol biopolymer transport system component